MTTIWHDNAGPSEGSTRPEMFCLKGRPARHRRAHHFIMCQSERAATRCGCMYRAYDAFIPAHLSDCIRRLPIADMPSKRLFQLGGRFHNWRPSARLPVRVTRKLVRILHSRPLHCVLSSECITAHRSLAPSLSKWPSPERIRRSLRRAERALLAAAQVGSTSIASGKLQPPLPRPPHCYWRISGDRGVNTRQVRGVFAHWQTFARRIPPVRLVLHGAKVAMDI